ncbi:MAG: hypothetical protein J7L15_01810 [Clostridiales bacterium]|nr:hypothetical protein [Clostridiales bacterium]
MISLISENILHKTGAFASGLMGGPVGGATGAVQGVNKLKYQAQLAHLNKDKKTEWKANNTGFGKVAAKGILGSIPGVGAVTNTINQFKLDNLKKQVYNHPNMKSSETKTKTRK